MARVLGVFAVAAVLLALGSAPAPARDAPRRPVVLLLHGGGFVFDATEMPYAQATAERMGFRARFVAYPSGDLPGAVRAAREAAREERAGGRQVYAYGESAGGLLAALLAQEDRVGAASTYCPIADMERFAAGFEDPEWYQRFIQASDRDLRRYSPARHDSRRPIFAMRAIHDSRAFNRPIRRWDLHDADVSSVVVPGKHLEATHRPSVYRENVRHGLRWLARTAGLESPAA